MPLDITVHHFNVDSSPPSAADLLGTALRLVDAATSSSRWRFIHIPSTAIHSSHRSSIGSCFAWGKEPPLIDRSIWAAGEEKRLHDWDAPIEDDIAFFDRVPLLEFEVTDFKDILHPKSGFTNRPPRSDPTPYGRRSFANDVDVNTDTRPRKRFCSQYEPFSSDAAILPISRLIPFPHYYESPDPARQPPPGIENIPAFRIARSLSPSVLLTMPFARTAWLVPLRGIPPIEGASAAHIDNTLTYEQPPLDEPFPRTIQWTSAAVTQFWNFLLRQRNTNNFGPISLACLFSTPSIQTGCREKREARRSNKLGEDDAIRTKKDNKLKLNDKRVVGLENRDETTTEKVWEYIKIYHDSQYAMKLRSLLDSFRWENDTDGRKTTGDALPLQRRVLKATRLVLVDETGDAILLA